MVIDLAVVVGWFIRCWSMSLVRLRIELVLYKNQGLVRSPF